MTTKCNTCGHELADGAPLLITQELYAAAKRVTDLSGPFPWKLAQTIVRTWEACETKVAADTAAKIASVRAEYVAELEELRGKTHAAAEKLRSEQDECKELFERHRQRCIEVDEAQATLERRTALLRDGAQYGAAPMSPQRVREELAKDAPAAQPGKAEPRRCGAA